MERAQEQAQRQLDGIIELLAAYDKAQESGSAEYDGSEYDADGIDELIHQDPLELLVRSSWVPPGDELHRMEAAEYLITLCTGGPAVRIVGELSAHGEPVSAQIEYQDWSTPWTELGITSEQQAELVRYASFFYYGD